MLSNMNPKENIEKKYFIDDKKFNCPFCKTRSVKFTLFGVQGFDWSQEKESYIHIVRCDECDKCSMHLSYEDLREFDHRGNPSNHFDPHINIDSKLYYSVPSSFFVLDNRIPSKLRELITEAEGCQKMNYLTGASACIRKSIYELTVIGGSTEGDYENRIKGLKAKFPDVNPIFFDTLDAIKDITSDKVHEQSWEAWDSKTLRMIIDTLKSGLHEMFIMPEEKRERHSIINALRDKMRKKKVKGEDGSS